MIAKVIFPKSSKQYAYFIPEKLKLKVNLHVRVVAPFGHELKIGLITKLTKLTQADNKHELKAIERIIDKEPIINEEQWELAEKVSEQTLSELGDAIFAMIPSGKRETLSQKENPTFANAFTMPPLTEDQKQVLQEIKQKNNSKVHVHLLHGITGSGKTRIYLEILQEYVHAGLSCILLVPEIALSYQFLAGMKPLFQEKMAILHSGLSKSERLLEYKRILKGEANLVVGTRSAIFAPLFDVSLVIIDEEHDSSYKENRSPRYDARKVAYTRLLMNKTKLPTSFAKRLLLASATPSVESYHYAVQKKFSLHTLSRRATGQPLPKITLVHYDSLDSTRPALSVPLREKAREHLQAGNQVLFLLNRRGHSQMAYCPQCEKSVQCPNCSLSLTVHRHYTNPLYRCHFCGYEEELGIHCPVCHAKYKFTGRGTQKLEDEIEKSFPNVEYARVDQDSSKQVGFLEDVLQAVRDHKIHILLGTQMLAKGFDLPGVTLVGILAADHSLFLPDFRSAERVFQLILQAAGRSGRHQIGEVIVQTMQPSHYAVANAAKYNYTEFAKTELQFRRDLLYPPFARIARFLLRTSSKEDMEKILPLLSQAIQSSIFQNDLFTSLEKTDKPIEILGPMPAPIEKLAGEYRYQWIFRSLSEHHLLEACHRAKKNIDPILRKSAIKWEFDVNPVQML